MRRVLLALLFACNALAQGGIELPDDVYPIGLAAAPDGTLWYASPREIGRVLPNGTVERVAPPEGYYVEKWAPVVALPDGTARIGSVLGKIVKVDARMQVTTIDLNTGGYQHSTVSDMVYGPDGNVWFLANPDFVAPFLGRLDPSGAITRFPLPLGSARRMAVAPDGSFFIAAGDHLYRATTSGAITTVAECQYCSPSWVEVTPDGTVWTSAGRLQTDGTFVRSYHDGPDATVGPFGNLWVAPRTNALRVYGEGGALVREVPFLDPHEEPFSIAFSRGALWYGVRGAIRRFDPKTHVGMHLQLGDIVAVELEPNCCFEGSHPVLAFHCRGGPTPFVRRIEATQDGGYGGGDIFAVDASRIVIEETEWLAGEERSILTVLDADGTPRELFVGPAATHGRGIVVDRAGRIHALRDPLLQADEPHRLLTYGPGGTLMRDIPLPIPAEVDVEAIDLAADQCTLYYAAYSNPPRFVGRVDICTGGILANLVSGLTDFPRDLRVLPGGDILVVSARRLVRYKPDGTVVKQLETTEQDPFSSVALDRDPEFVWIGARELRRVHLATGEIVERLEVYGPPRKISIIGEPRAARQPIRRRAARR